MNTSKAVLLWAAVLASAVSTLPAQTSIPVRVTADNVNLRAKPLLTAEVVAQAKYNDELVARDIGEEWVEVDAPATVDFWVNKEFVQVPQNTIGTQRVNVRAGPSINYNIVATLSMGDKIEPRGEEMQGWLKIAPPPTAHVWVSRDFVEILSGMPPVAIKYGKTDEISVTTAKNASDEASTAEKSSKKKKSKAKTGENAAETADIANATPNTALPTPIVSPSIPVKDSIVREIPVPPPADLKLIPLEGQGRLTEVEGELRAAPLINEAPTRYRVVRWENNRWQILCHVYGAAAKFRSLQDKHVALKGREYWIQGAAAPVLIPDQVQELPPATDASTTD